MTGEGGGEAAGAVPGTVAPRRPARRLVERLRPDVRHLEEHRDALPDRRVRVEHAGHLLGLLQRVLDVEVRRRPVGVAQRPGVGGDGVERARQAQRVARELDGRGVGEVLAAARDGELHGVGRERREDGQHDGDDGEDRAGLVAARVAAAAAAAHPAPEAPAQEEVGDERDHADQDADQRLEADVVVADVRHLVGDDALELLAVEAVEQPARDGDGGVLRVAPGGQGVGRGLVEHVHRRHLRQAGGDRHLLDDVEELRLLGVGHAVGAAHREHHLVAAVVADDAPGDGDDAEHAEQPDAALRAADGGVADGEAQHGQDGDDEPGQQPGRPAVAADLFVHAGARPQGRASTSGRRWGRPSRPRGPRRTAAW